ncbi:MAG: tyrosine-type recombinase/integrase [Hydrogenophaga sp.]|uniref:tyrosine-type recombinase/integrase n=1 Tax=Hydrogenophaga sp. TaxID=1904254 RepID=UPI003D0AE56C
MPLTDAAIKNAKPGEKPIKLFDGNGLYLEVSPSGGKWWRLKYRIEGKEKRLSLGTYPETSLRAARERRESTRALIADGQDPSADRKARKAKHAAAADDLFETIAREWWKSWATTRTAKHADQVLRRMEKDVFPTIGALPVGKIKAPMLLTLAKKVEARGANDLARRAYQVAGQVLRYAVGHGFIDHNPAASVRPSDVLKPKVERNLARLDPREVPELLRKIETYDGHIRTRLAIKLMALTFVRTAELIGARWEEFDFDAKQWRIPAERMKMKAPHIVPLSRQSLALLSALKNAGTGESLLFPGERDHDKPMSNNTILYALYRMGYHSRMTGHGFRGVASTMLHELGERHDLIELQLAHQERNKVSAAYNHATYLPQRALMMQAWADHLDMLRRGGEVIPMRAA